MKTFPIIRYGDNIAIKNGGTYVVENPTDGADLKAFASANTVRDGISNNYPFATYEPNFWLLDGNYKLLPDLTTAQDVGIIANSMSDGSGDFASSSYYPFLQITFDTAYDLTNIILKFMPYTGDYSSSLSISYYNNGLTLIQTDTHSPTNTEYQTEDSVSGVKRVIIRFQNTYKANRYVRLTSIDFNAIPIEGTKIRRCEVVEQIDQTSFTLPFNTLEFSIIDSAVATAFDIYPEIVQETAIDVYAGVGGVTKYMGQFFVKNRNNRSLHEVEFECIAILGKFEDIDYEGYYTGYSRTISDFIDEFQRYIDFTEDIDASLTSRNINEAYFESGKLRDILSAVCLSTDSYATNTRSKSVVIKPLKLVSEILSFIDITNSEQSITGLDLQDYPTRVDATFFLPTQYSTDYDLIYFYTFPSAGTYRIRLKGLYQVPDVGITGTGGSGLSVDYPPLDGSNYYTSFFDITLTGGGTISIYGYKISALADGWALASYNDGSLKTKLLNIKIFLYYYMLLDLYVPRIYNFYQQKYIHKATVYSTNGTILKAGDAINCPTLGGNTFSGVIEKLTVDIASGFRQKIEARGTIA